MEAASSGKASSNKIQKPLKLFKLKAKPPQVSPPFIDRLTLVLTPNSPDFAALLHSSVHVALGDHETFQSGPGPSSFSGNANWQGKKNSARFIALPGEEHRVLFQFEEDKHLKVATRIRLDFNPSRFSSNGMMKLHAVLSSLLEDGWLGFAHLAKITRIDIALDFPSVRMDDFLFLVPSGLTHQTWGTDGHLETLTFGQPQGSQTLVYNKKLEQLATGKNWAGKTTVRVERRLRGQQLKIGKLPELPNPFAKLTMIKTMPAPPAGYNDKQLAEWTVFLDSVRVRGTTAALALIPATRRAAYRKHLSDNQLPWWQPSLAWKSWGSALSVLNV